MASSLAKLFFLKDFQIQHYHQVAEQILSLSFVILYIILRSILELHAFKQETLLALLSHPRCPVHATTIDKLQAMKFF